VCAIKAELARAPTPLHQEIHYRLLMSATGKVLHNLFLKDSHSSHIREQLAAPLRVPELAEQVGMSNSAFNTLKPLLAQRHCSIRKTYA